MAMLSIPRRPPPLFYGWYIVGASTVNAALLLGMVFYGFGVFITPLTNDLGWTTSAVALGFTFQRIEAGLMGPLAGYAIDRLGSRPVALIGVAVVGVGFLVFAGVQELWQFYAASILIAIGQTMGTIAPFSAALMHWFYRYRARATAFMMAGTGLGAVSIYPLVAVVEAVGWRTTLVLVAALVWVVGGLTALVLRRPPQRYGLLPDGVAVVDTTYPCSPSTQPAPAESSEDYGLGVGQAVRTRAFWLLLATTILFGFGNLGWVVLQFPALEAKGFSAGVASMAVAVYGFAAIGSRVALGIFGDRMGRQRLYRMSFLFQAAGLAVFALADVFWQLIPYYFLYGVGHAAYVNHQSDHRRRLFRHLSLCHHPWLDGDAVVLGWGQRARGRSADFRQQRLLHAGVSALRIGRVGGVPCRVLRGSGPAPVARAGAGCRRPLPLRPSRETVESVVAPTGFEPVLPA